MDDPQSLNLYTYVRDNPLTSADADGHQQGPDITITIDRDTTTQKSTTGTVQMRGGNDRSINGYSLELPLKGDDPNPKRVAGRINPGTYDAEYKTSLSNGTPALYELTQSETKGGIDGRTSIYGHVGNTAVDSEGCQLFGSSRAKNSIQGSRDFIAKARSMFSDVAKDNHKPIEQLRIRVVINPSSSDEIDTPIKSPLPSGRGSPTAGG